MNKNSLLNSTHRFCKVNFTHSSGLSDVRWGEKCRMSGASELTITYGLCTRVYCLSKTRGDMSRLEQ